MQKGTKYVKMSSKETKLESKIQIWYQTVAKVAPKPPQASPKHSKLVKMVQNRIQKCQKTDKIVSKTQQKLRTISETMF